jgi:enterochelin esterase-like enzyme
MHDGQMLFDSSMTWNKQSWDVDNVITKLLNDKKIKNTIVVGIWNNGKSRHAEYFPQKPFESLSISEKDSLNKQLRDAGRTTDIFTPISDAYLKSIVEEIIPFITANYSVKNGIKNTLISGSSMGDSFHFMRCVNILKFSAVQHVFPRTGQEHSPWKTTLFQLQ